MGDVFGFRFLLPERRGGGGVISATKAPQEPPRKPSAQGPHHSPPQTPSEPVSKPITSGAALPRAPTRAPTAPADGDGGAMGTTPPGGCPPPPPRTSPKGQGSSFFFCLGGAPQGTGPSAAGYGQPPSVGGRPPSAAVPVPFQMGPWGTTLHPVWDTFFFCPKGTSWQPQTGSCRATEGGTLAPCAYPKGADLP